MESRDYFVATHPAKLPGRPWLGQAFSLRVVVVRVKEKGDCEDRKSHTGHVHPSIKKCAQQPKHYLNQKDADPERAD